MKAKLLRISKMAAVIAGMTMVAGCYATPTNSVAATNPPDASLLTYQPAPDLEQLPATNTVAAPEPATALPSAEKATLPTNFTPSPQLAEVIKLVQAGIDGPVLTSYITNATAPFDISAEAIIYLNDLGVPNETILTMMQRDYALGYTVAPNPPPAALPATMPDTNAIADVTNTAPEVAGGPAVPDEPAAVIEEPAPVASVTDFYDTLSPYGTWIDIEGYGRCWQPTIVVSEPAWQPYCDRGHWVYSDCGWYWASDYSWGLTFHYGRWFRHSRWGWCWVPDTTWGPSWVSWRNSGRRCRRSPRLFPALASATTAAMWASASDSILRRIATPSSPATISTTAIRGIGRWPGRRYGRFIPRPPWLIISAATAATAS